MLNHCYATEAVMRAIARRLGRDEERWAIAGLLHDLDVELTNANLTVHGRETERVLRERAVDEEIIDAIVMHNETLTGKKRATEFQHALAAGETITGMIVATALVYPDKKLGSVKPKSITKRMKEKAFAASVNTRYHNGVRGYRAAPGGVRAAQAWKLCRVSLRNWVPKKNSGQSVGTSEQAANREEPGGTRHRRVRIHAGEEQTPQENDDAAHRLPGKGRNQGSVLHGQNGHRELLSAEQGLGRQKAGRTDRPSRKCASRKALCPGKKLLFLGKSYPLRLAETNAEIPALSFCSAGFTLPKEHAVKARELFIKSYGAKVPWEKITEKVLYFSKRLDLLPQGIRLMTARTQWGSCSPDNRLSFNWKLIMAGDAFIDYVVAHELLHIKEKNHSSRFWGALGSFMPDYRERKKPGSTKTGIC